jgi:hypothetical protein
MPDWRNLVAERLTGVALGPQEKAGVIAELAAHLEDVYEALHRQGITEDEATRRALAQVDDWRALRHEIALSKGRRPFMQKRLWQVWVPGFLTMILSMLALAAVRALGFQPRVVSGGSNPALLYTAWVLSLPLFGALAAYISSRAGGSRQTAVFAAAFPILALTLAFLLMAPIGLALGSITGRPNEFGAVASVLLRDALGWLLVPGVALLIGGVLAGSLVHPRQSQRDAVLG